jgi:hypothetical protein
MFKDCKTINCKECFEWDKKYGSYLCDDIEQFIEVIDGVKQCPIFNLNDKLYKKEREE